VAVPVYRRHVADDSVFEEFAQGVSAGKIDFLAAHGSGELLAQCLILMSCCFTRIVFGVRENAETERL